MYNYLDKFVNDYSYRQLLIHYTVICNLSEEYSKIYGVNFLDVVERYTDTDEISGLVEHKMLDHLQDLERINCEAWLISAIDEAVCELLFD